MKLYYAYMTSSLRPRWLLEELAVPHELVHLSLAAGDHKRAEYLEIHPHGHVPALVDGALVVTESAAICLHLADRFADRGLAPALGSPARARYYEWIMFAMTALTQRVVDVYHRAYFGPPERRAETATDDERAALAQLLEPLARHLERHGHVTGEGFSAADIVLAGVLEWARVSGQLRGCAAVEAYLERVRARPAFQRASAD
ncbi:MAG: glutathione S-transferase family protein [Myxococcales bacterium]|nr:glutathione S-transferase family protein [Myxococcales bacterium]